MNSTMLGFNVVWYLVEFLLLATVVAAFVFDTRAAIRRRSGEAAAVVTRGEISWANIVLAFVVMFGVVSSVTGAAMLSPLVGQLAHVVNSLLLFYLCFRSAWFRNKLVGYGASLRKEDH